MEEITITSSSDNYLSTQNFGTQTVNSDAPVVTIKQEPSRAQSFFSVTVWITATDCYGSGVQDIQYSLDGGTTYQEYNEETGIILDQSCTVTAKAIDNVGNVGIASEDIFKIADDPNPVVDGYTTYAYADYSYDSITVKNSGILSVGNDATVSAKTLILEDGQLVNDGGGVSIENLVLSKECNVLSQDTMSIAAVQFGANSELSLDKTQYDNMMAFTTFSGIGKLTVREVTGEAIRQSDIETLIKKANVTNVEFQQDLISLYNLKIASGKNLTVSFRDAHGTTKSDKIRFLKNSTVTFGAKNRFINLEEGKNEIRMDSGAQVTIKSDLSNVSVVKAEKSSKEQTTNVKLANVDFAVDRAATLGIGNYGVMDIVGNVTGSAKSDQITTGTGSDFEALGVNFGAGNDKITTGTESTTFIDALQFGDGNDKITTGKSSYFLTDSIDFGAGNDTLSIGKGSSLIWEDNRNVDRINFGEGKNTLSGTTGSVLQANKILFGAGNDKVNFTGSGSSLTAVELDLGDGNDTLNFGSGMFAKIDALDFGAGKDTLKIGKGSTVVLNATELTSDSLKLSIGKDSTLYFSDNLYAYTKNYFAPGYLEEHNIALNYYKDYSPVVAVNK